jgi:hypothetical protein
MLIICFRNLTNKMSITNIFEHVEVDAFTAARNAPCLTSGGDGDSDSRSRAQSSALIVAKTATTST